VVSTKQLVKREQQLKDEMMGLGVEIENGTKYKDKVDVLSSEIDRLNKELPAIVAQQEVNEMNRNFNELIFNDRFVGDITIGCHVMSINFRDVENTLRSLYRQRDDLLDKKFKITDLIRHHEYAIKHVEHLDDNITRLAEVKRELADVEAKLEF
jgi:prefoldin subunit 5